MWNLKKQVQGLEPENVLMVTKNQVWMDECGQKVKPEMQYRAQ